MAERGDGQPSWSLTPYQVSVSYQASVQAPGVGSGWFGPLQPMHPIAPPAVAGRVWDFIPGYNLATRARVYEPITFETLRALPRAYDPLRLVIDKRKDQIGALRWNIRPRETKHKDAEVPPETQKRIDALRAFWQKPDGVTPFRTWLRRLLEDLFVIDAPSLYCQRTRGGRLYALRWTAGDTIKPVIDDWGRTPEPIPYSGKSFVWNSAQVDETNWRQLGFKLWDGKLYPPAYQQILKGLPAVDLTTRDLIYRPYNHQPHSPYGLSPVEMIVTTINIAMRRQAFQLEYYRAGSTPDALIEAPQSWSPQQIADFQDWWDAQLSGNLAERRRTRFIPAGSGKLQNTKDPDLTGGTDEWLARIVCFAFNYPVQAFVRMMNRATSETHREQAAEEGIEPTKIWVKDLIDDINATEFGCSDLELAWAEQDDVDPQVHEEIVEGRTKTGLFALNEGRRALGIAPIPDPIFDKPMVLTAKGYVPVDANMIEGRNAMTDAFPQHQASGQEDDTEELQEASQADTQSGELLPDAEDEADRKRRRAA